MLKVWGRPNSVNVQKVTWTLAELGLDHERVDAGGAFGGLDTPDFGGMNPNRLIPVLQDGPVAVWESNAIVRYLAARHGQGGLWPEDPAERALADRWMDWQLTTVQPALGPVFLGLVRTPPERRDAAAIAQQAERLVAAMRILDGHLAGRRFVAGEAFTMGDVPVGATCWRYHSLPINRPELPQLARWHGELQERQGFRTHVMLPLT